MKTNLFIFFIYIIMIFTAMMNNMTHPQAQTKTKAQQIIAYMNIISRISLHSFPTSLPQEASTRNRNRSYISASGVHRSFIKRVPPSFIKCVPRSFLILSHVSSLFSLTILVRLLILML